MDIEIKAVEKMLGGVAVSVAFAWIFKHSLLQGNSTTLTTYTPLACGSGRPLGIFHAAGTQNLIVMERTCITAVNSAKPNYFLAIA